ncbi:F-box/FBD/LRR-repeat protein [Rhynchospora pubera]|uniref:F-box/FBD/LRR-repeat protein n=1 Tax=Rhynchospora pubera TaxID=906938 RepID=A0AAV8DTR1_9POAL|nr:F-box/FBD/LRR-repeat protein [Rhynchospora pubera]
MGGVDRISALPDEIKISILSRLKVKYAIRTSALARSWRHLWTHLPCLRLGLRPYQDRLGGNTASVTTDWIERAHHLVSSLRGPLDLFELIHRFTSDQAPLIQRLLHLLLQKGGVEKLYLEFLYHPQLVHLPPFHSLKVLQLCKCHVLLPNGFQGFRSLTTLELDHVQISSDHLNFLIHTSNNLTTFLGSEFLVSEDPLSITITSPLLRHLTFEIDDSIEKVSVSSAPCLEKVEIMDCILNRTDSSSKKLAPVALGLLVSVATVSSLNLESNILRSLSLVTLPIDFSFSQLRSLSFDFYIDTMNERMCDAFFWLLRSMPFLEELNLLYEYSGQINRVVILMEELLGKESDGISCLNQTLKSVTISTSDIMNAINFGKYILLNAKVLKLMKFHCLKWSYVEPGIIEELQKAEVTPSNAKVVIFCDNEGVTINVK